MKTVRAWENFLSVPTRKWKYTYAPGKFERLTQLSKETYRAVRHVIFKWMQTWDERLYLNGSGHAILLHGKNKWMHFGRKRILDLFKLIALLLKIYHGHSELVSREFRFYRGGVYRIDTVFDIPVLWTNKVCRSSVYAYELTLHPKERRRLAWQAWYHGNLNVLPRDVLRETVKRI